MTNEERQQAIEWMKRRPVMMAGAKRMYNLAVEALEAYVPDTNDGKAETSCESNTKITRCSNDTISRQAAIDLLKQMRKDGDMVPWEGKNVFARIRKSPSAQPERTCVNCGRTVNNGGWYADGGTRCPIEEHYALPKDGYCHLWEKRNVTDDNYPERREE